MHVIYLNGKFAAQRTTGVQRVAAELIAALDSQLEGHAGRWVLLIPAGAPRPSLRWIEVREIGWRGIPLHVWEQCLLPWAARWGSLVNLSGSAPWLARTQSAMLHDAAVFDHPSAYAPAFVGWYRSLFRRLASSRAGLMTVSNFSRNRLAACLGVPEERILVVPCGVDHLSKVQPDTAVLRRLGLEGRRFFLAVGSANPTKNLGTLERAFARLPARLPDGLPLRLVIVGGSNRRVFAATPSTSPGGVPGVVRVGPVDDAALKALYEHAIALIFPSLYEGFGLPPLEAMSCGCPVAAARVASIPEACGDAAIYFNPRSEQEIVAAMERLVHEPSLVQNLIRSGRERAASFRWETSARILLARHLADESAAGSP